MNEVKILFADLYRMVGQIKSETKEIQKMANDLPIMIDWVSMANTAEVIMSQAMRVRNLSDAIVHATISFIQNGPYEGQRPGVTPMEALAEEDDGK